MAVAVHNPSNLELSTLTINVPHGHWDVRTYDEKSGEMVEASDLTNVLCNHQPKESDPSSLTHTCTMYVTKQSIKPFTVGFFTLTYNEEKDLAYDADIVEHGEAMIESEDLKLTFNVE